MAEIRVNPHEMRTAADEIEQMAHDYTQQVSALYEVGQQLDGMWDGEASDTFKSQLGQDRPRFDALETVVKVYIVALRKNADSYELGDKRAIEILNT